jgi:hypothetical protein
MSQIMIAFFGVTAVFLSQDHDVDRRKYACLFGLMAQPFWFYETYSHGQWGIFALSFFYTASWLRGFHVHWVKP